jgi:VanZ family protein
MTAAGTHRVVRPRRSVLPHLLAITYGLAIAYASLQPFGPWMAPAAGTPFFLFPTALPRFTRFDVLANVLAYLPLGFLLSFVPRVRSPWVPFALALACGTALSFVLETLQMLLPLRDASIIDFVSNGIGAAFGGAIGVMVAFSEPARDAIAPARQRLFLGGKVGDLGLALVLVWLVVQVNPGIPLFATMFDPATELPPLPGVNAERITSDLAALLIEAAHSAFQLLGVGLFLALLLRERRLAGAALLILLGTAVLTKTLAAAILLHPLVLQRWLRPGVSAGIAAGAVLLMLAVWLPRPAQVAIATVALLSSLLATLLAPELIFSPAPLAIFNWSYGHLLTFNGLTHTVLLLWPVAASAFLFTLAGKPRWGAPG